MPPNFTDHAVQLYQNKDRRSRSFLRSVHRHLLKYRKKLSLHLLAASSTKLVFLITALAFVVATSQARRSRRSPAHSQSRVAQLVTELQSRTWQVHQRFIALRQLGTGLISKGGALDELVGTRSSGRKRGSEEALARFSESYNTTFCHSQAGVQLVVRTGTKMRRALKHCFGDIHAENATVQLEDSAIVAPMLTSLCAANPYHGFFDCIWPLVHYLTACVPSARRANTVVVTDASKLLPKRRRIAWVVRVQTAYLAAAGVRVLDKRNVSAHQVTCFRQSVRFNRSTLWRPLAFGVTLKSGGAHFAVAHPEPLRRAGMRALRAAVLAQFALTRDPLARTVRPQVVVYDRVRTKRRRWRNGRSFARLLRTRLGSRADVEYIAKMPRHFDSQVALFHNTTLHVAPHGAAMANSLFMRDNSGVIEIASRECAAANSSKVVVFDAAAMQTDPNAWTVWHTAYLGIHLVHAPCVEVDAGNGDFVTDIPSLVSLTEMMLDAQLVNSEYMGA